MKNNSKIPCQILTGDRFAQMIFKKIWSPTVEIVDKLPTTERGTGGFGSTNQKKMEITPPPKPALKDNYPLAAAAAAMKIKEGPIEFSANPYDHEMDITIPTDSDHPTLGLDLQHCKTQDRPQLIACSKGTPAGRINKWRSTLRNGFVLAINKQPVQTIPEIKQMIKDNTDTHLTFTFGTIDRHAMHPQSGVPQLYFDQLHHIGEHLFAMKHDPEWQSAEQAQDGITIKCLKQAVLPKSRRHSTKLT